MEPKRILCLGDSNTYGYDPASLLDRRYPGDVRWTGRLQSCGWQVFNRGMNGSTVPARTEHSAIRELVESLQPLDAITVMFGTNDVLRGAAAKDAAEQMKLLLPVIRSCAEDAVTVLIAPPPVTFGDWVQEMEVIQQSEKIPACYHALSEEQNVHFADAGKWNVSLTFDGVHFTPEGHAAFFRGLAPLLNDLMRK